MQNIIIVGGGIVGASFAYHASQHNLNKITILSDSLPGDSKQATTNSWGWVNGYAVNDKSYADFRLANLNYWPKLLEEVGNLKHLSKGAFFWDLNDSELNHMINEHKSWGHSVDLVFQSEIQKKLHQLKKIPSQAGFGKHDLAIEGSKFTSELIKASGSDIRNIKVTDLICESNRVIGLRTLREVLYADEIILAAGLGTPELLSSININFKMCSTLGLLAYTKPLPQLLKFPITGLNFHVRQDDKGRLIIGGKFNDDASNERNIKKAAEKLVKDMALRLNYNDEILLDHFTLGRRPLPLDGRPKIGRLKNQFGKEVEGIYLSVMHSGITNAPLAGKLGMEEIINGERHSLISDFITQKTIDNEI